MRLGFADFSPTVPATFAVGVGISLSVFLLPTGVVDKGPTPIVPAFGGAAGRVVADLPVERARAASEAPKAGSPHPQILVASRPPTTKAPRVRHRARTVVVRRAPSAPVRAVARVTHTKAELFAMPPRGKGRALGHGPKSKAPNTNPDFPGRGKALGHSNENQNSLPPGLAKKASPGSSPPPRGNGRGNGRKGDASGNEGQGKGGGNGRKWGEN